MRILLLAGATALALAVPAALAAQQTADEANAQAQPAPATSPAAPAAEEEFYPPDHHMHSSQRATAQVDSPAAADGDAASQQGQLDLTTPDAEPPVSGLDRKPS